MRITTKILSIALISITMLYFTQTSCKRENNKLPVLNIDSDSLALAKKFEQAKEILYSLPSPNEVTSVLLEADNTKFYSDLLNSTTNYSKYNTEISQALNLGIFSADLSYASIFEQNQVAVSYMATCKKLAENLRILEAFEQSTIDRMEKNLTNRDSIMRIISETFMNSDAFLQENNRQDIGALILIGGWIEGLYISTQITNGKINSNPQLVSSILEQQLSLELIVKFLKDFKSNKMEFVTQQINDLYTIYTNISTTITDKSLMTCPQDDFSKLYNKVNELRTAIVSMN